jgi:GAF domain-containing protein
MIEDLFKITRLASGFECARAVALFGQAIGSDRCFLYVRDPHLRLGQIAALWRASELVPDLPEDTYHGFEAEPDHLFTDDPMFKAALTGHPVTAVNDIFASGGLVNPEFELSYNHRCLLHINLFAEGQLWGVLQPAMSYEPRAWSKADLAAAEQARLHLAPLLRIAIEAEGWPHMPARLTGVTR